MSFKFMKIIFQKKLMLCYVWYAIDPWYFMFMHCGYWLSIKLMFSKTKFQELYPRSLIEEVANKIVEIVAE